MGNPGLSFNLLQQLCNGLVAGIRRRKVHEILKVYVTRHGLLRLLIEFSFKVEPIFLRVEIAGDFSADHLRVFCGRVRRVRIILERIILELRVDSGAGALLIRSGRVAGLASVFGSFAGLLEDFEIGSRILDGALAGQLLLIGRRRFWDLLVRRRGLGSPAAGQSRPVNAPELACNVLVALCGHFGYVSSQDLDSCSSQQEFGIV